MRFKTIQTKGFNRCVNQDKPNPAAHGCVCHTQAAKRKKQVYVRHVNVNQCHIETGPAIPIEESNLSDQLRNQIAALMLVNL